MEPHPPFNVLWSPFPLPFFARRCWSHDVVSTWNHIPRSWITEEDLVYTVQQLEDNFPGYNGTSWAPTSSPIGSPTNSPFGSSTSSLIGSPTSSSVGSLTSSPTSSPTSNPIGSPTSSPASISIGSSTSSPTSGETDLHTPADSSPLQPVWLPQLPSF